MQKAYKILADVFGYQTFRPLQQEIINNIIQKKDTLVVMPTGGGKSLCYQIPALVFQGLTIVISPLISLMKDQVTQLGISGVKAAVLNSSIPKTEYYKNYKMAESGEAKLLYIAPESLSRDGILQLLKNLKVDCIAVDEAHCISEWGHDFRKEYRQIGNLRENFPYAVCVALTATATPKVQDDIITNLKMKDCRKFIGSFNRENLFLEVIRKSNPVQQTVNFLKNRKGQSGIIYCFSRAQVDDLSSILSAYGFSNKPYHAGMTDEDRNKNQELFIKEEIDIIVATIAFGMGINKSNVRFIIHYDLPKNLESYYQEIGRSGRDGLRADCLLLFSYADIRKIRYFIDEKESETERKSAEMHLEAMIKYAQAVNCRRIRLINYFGEKYYTDNCGMCDNCLESGTDQTDITIAAQKFLSAVKRTGEIYGAAYISDLLTGKHNEKIISNNHDKLTVYNIGKDYSRKEWMQISNILEAQDILKRDNEYGSLRITEKGKLVLQRRLFVSGSIKEREREEREIKINSNELFEILRRKRKEIADKKDVPPYIIFSDATLLEMSSIIPLNLAEMNTIHGIGMRKLESFGEEFLSIIKTYYSHNNKAEEIRTINRVKEIYKSERVIGRRSLAVGKTFKSGTSVEQLIEMYNVKQERIFYHLLRYSESGYSFDTEDLKKYVSLARSNWEEVFNAFKKLGADKLSTIYTNFEGRINYNDIRILLIIYLQDNIKESKIPNQINRE